MHSDRCGAVRGALALCCAWVIAFPPLIVVANPRNGAVVDGAATVSESGKTLTVNQQSHRAAMSWESFDISGDETTVFVQPSARAVALNRVLNGQASNILGRLEANGQVYLINPAGVIFGKGSTVDTQSFVAATQFDASKVLDGDAARIMSAQGLSGAVKNEGTLLGGKSEPGGMVALIGSDVDQAGSIQVKDGKILLAAGAKATFTDASGLAYVFENTGANAEPLDLAGVVAANGASALRSAVVRQSGSLEATGATVQENGQVRLVGGQAELVGGRVELVGGSQLDVDRSIDVQAAQRVDVLANSSTGEKVVALEGGNAQSTLHVRSAGDIAFGPEAQIGDTSTAGDAGGVDLVAGADLAAPADSLAVRGGAKGSVLLSGGQFDPETGALVPGLEAENGGQVALGSGKLNVRAAGDLVLGSGGGLVTGSGDIDARAAGNVRFRANDNTVDTRIQTETGNIRVEAGGSVDLSDGTFQGNAAIRSRGRKVVESDGRTFIRNQGGGKVFVWAKTGDIDAGVGNRWVSPPLPRSPAALSKAINEPVPNFDPLPVAPEGILGIGSEAGSDVTVIAGGNVRTRPPGDPRDPVRSGGSAAGLGTTRDGSHIGVFGQEREIRPINPRLAILLPRGVREFEIPVAASADRAPRLLVAAGGDIAGDVMMRDGKATLRAGYDLSAAGKVNAGGLGGLLRDSQGKALGKTALDAQFLGSAAVERNPLRGWLGTAENPLTIDLHHASVDGRGRNGVVLRAIESPSLVYPTNQATGGNGSSPGYGEEDEALIEAERGDIALLGTDTVLRQRIGSSVQNIDVAAVRVLPPKITLRTRSFERQVEALVKDAEGKEELKTGTEKRGGDLVLLNDFLLAPSRKGKLTVDVAGQVRTAGSVGTGKAVLALDVRSTGETAKGDVPLPTNLPLKRVTGGDPSVPFDVLLADTASGPAVVRGRQGPIEATGNVRFLLNAQGERDGVKIPAGTHVVARDGEVYELQTDAELAPIEERFSQAQITLRLRSTKETLTPLQFDPAAVYMVNRKGEKFFFTQSGAIDENQRSTTLTVRSEKVGLRAATRELKLAGPVIDLVRDVRGVASVSDIQQGKGQVTLTLASPAAQDLNVNSNQLASAQVFLETADGVRFRLAGDTVIKAGDTSVTLPVQFVGGVVDMAAPRLQLAGPLVEIVHGQGAATNLSDSVSPAVLTARVQALRKGSVGNATEFEIHSLGGSIQGVEGVINPTRIVGSDQQVEGFAGVGVLAPLVRSELLGPAGVIPDGTELRPVTRAELPADFDVSELQFLPDDVNASELRFTVFGVDATSQAAKTPGVFRQPVVQFGEGSVRTRIDPDPRQTPPSLATEKAYLRAMPGPLAVIKQSDAHPDIDQRGNGTFDYFDYFSRCRSGAPCSVSNRELALGAGPTHAGDPTPAQLFADGGFHRIGFELAMPASVYSGADLFDLRLITQHTQPTDPNVVPMTQIAVPNGSASFATEVSQSGVLVNGPGRARLLVGVVPHTTPLTGFDLDRDDGRGPVPPESLKPRNQPGAAGIVREAFVVAPDAPAPAGEVFDAIDDPSDLPPAGDGVLTAQEAPFVPTGAPGSGRIQLDDLTDEATLGFSTGGNLSNRLLPRGGASIEVIAAGDIDMRRFGAIGSVQGGDVHVSSVGGSVFGGDPPPTEKRKRGLFAVFADPDANAQGIVLGGGGNISVDAHGDIDPGGSAVVTLSGGNISLLSRFGSITFGRGRAFANERASVDGSTGVPVLEYEGAGVAASPKTKPKGNLDVKARQDINIGAGAFGGTINLDAGGGVGAGQGVVRGDTVTISSTTGVASGVAVQASSSISVSGGASSGASLSSTGFVSGAGSAGGSNAGKFNAETAVTTREKPAAVGNLGGGSGLGSGGGSRSVAIDVTSRPCNAGECD